MYYKLKEHKLTAKQNAMHNWKQVDNDATYFCWRCGGRLVHDYILVNRITGTHTSLSFDCKGEMSDGYCEVDRNYASAYNAQRAYGGY